MSRNLAAMTDFFLRDGDEQKAQGATHLDELDLIHSRKFSGPWGAALVAVAMKHGVHVCWQCGGYFDNQIPKFKPEEQQLGHSYILLHRGCIGGARLTSYRGFTDIERGLQARRFLAKATKTVAAAAESSQPAPAADTPIIVLAK
jgi:hypothetical protein